MDSVYHRGPLAGRNSTSFLLVIRLALFWGLALGATTRKLIPQNPSDSNIPFSETTNRLAHVNSVSGHAAGVAGETSTNADAGWDIKSHVGGSGPWIPRRHNVVTNDVNPPKGCVVEQVHMTARHGERFPTNEVARKMESLVVQMQKIGKNYTGKFAFLNEWKHFIDDPILQVEQLTTTGVYAGSLETFTTGVKFRSRYGHLIPRHNLTRIWASGSSRVVDTARYLTLGMFGLEANTQTELRVIEETLARGANTLTPSASCSVYNSDKTEGHDQGPHKQSEFKSHYLPAVKERLKSDLPDSLQLDDKDFFTMQQICGFEMTVRGHSPWCDIFTESEWEDYEYSNDVYQYYKAGPGNKYSKVLGTVWLNATNQILEKGPSAGPFFFSFTHDTDIFTNVAILTIFDGGDPLPTDKRKDDRNWIISQIMPMGGRLVLESLACQTDTHKGRFVRVNLNDGIVAIPSCKDGPGSSCPIDQFVRLMNEQLQKAPDFRKTCGLASDAPDGIDFFNHNEDQT